MEKGKKDYNKKTEYIALNVNDLKKKSQKEILKDVSIIAQKEAKKQHIKVNAYITDFIKTSEQLSQGLEIIKGINLQTPSISDNVLEEANNKLQKEFETIYPSIRKITAQLSIKCSFENKKMQAKISGSFIKQRPPSDEKYSLEQKLIFLEKTNLYLEEALLLKCKTEKSKKILFSITSTLERLLIDNLNAINNPTLGKRTTSGTLFFKTV